MSLQRRTANGEPMLHAHAGQPCGECTGLWMNSAPRHEPVDVGGHRLDERVVPQPQQCRRRHREHASLALHIETADEQGLRSSGPFPAVHGVVGRERERHMRQRKDIPRPCYCERLLDQLTRAALRVRSTTSNERAFALPTIVNSN